VGEFLQQASKATDGEPRALARVCPPHHIIDRRRAAAGVAVLYYAVVFFVIALVAAVFGFGGIAAGAVGIAKILFFVFMVVAVLSFVLGLARRT
jgi:uncharacterized membrane protein YtjA (UPF0391 family)